MDTDEHNSSVLEEGSDDEGDWEEVALPPPAAPVDGGETAPLAPYDPYAHVPADEPAPSEKAIEITIGTEKADAQAARPKGLSHAERLVRIDCHKFHTVALLSNAWVRNKWLNDELLHARLMSLTPLALQNAFAMIHKSRVPDAHRRGRLFETAVQRLVDWWLDFFEVVPHGHIRNRTFDEVEAELRVKAEARAAREAARAADRKGKGKQRARDTDSDADSDSDDENDDAEIIRSVKSLMKHALMQRGSRDMSAQLFTALCRALGVPARLVVSLQAVPWQASVGKPKPPGKKKKKAAAADGAAGGASAAPPGDVKGKGKARADGFPGDGARLDGGSIAGGSTASGTDTPARVIKLRKSRPAGQKLGSSPTPARGPRPADPLTSAPVFWTEVFSRADGRWMPVDPLRGTVNKRRAFDPAAEVVAGPGPRPKQENRMVYVVALEEDGYGKDVTPRYAKDYGAKVAKVQGAQRVGGSKARKEWWERVCAIVRRPYRLHRDDVEDDELQVNQLTEAMPTTMTGFKDHPLYALERHLRRDEIVHPLKELGKFRGEPVYPRANVLQLKAAENWMRSGRQVRAGAQPMKWVPQRAVTVHRKRELELARVDQGVAGEGAMQGMYALSQTELYTPPAVVNGKVPKNDFGNIDLYVPSMLPAGAVHIPHKGTAKIARKLGFDFAEAVTAFEFRKRKATPVITGIVIAAEHETVLLDAYWEAEHDAAEREAEKRRERVLKRWTRLVQGLRIRQRLQAQYAGEMPKETTVTVPVVDEPQEAGGFLIAADDVVQPYALPKFQHLQIETEAGPSRVLAVDPSPSKSVASEFVGDIRDLSIQFEDADEDAEMEEVPAPSTHSEAGPAPKTMEERALRAAQAHQPSAESSVASDASDPEEDSSSAGRSSRRRPQPKSTPANGRTTRTTRGSAKGKAAAPVASKVAPARRASGRQASRKRPRYDDGEEDDDDNASEAGNLLDPKVSGSRRRQPRAQPSTPPSTRVLRTRKSNVGNTRLHVEDSEEE